MGYSTKRTLLTMSLLLVAGLVVAGCQGDANSNAETSSVMEGTTENGSIPTEEEERDPGLLDSASKLVDNVRKSGADGMGWLQDQANGAAESGGQAVKDTSEWATSMFQTLKDQGMTTAQSTSDWVTQDFRNMGAWEYKVLKLSPEELAGSEQKLNELGQSRWECFHVANGVDGTLFYFKKRRRSYIRNLPMRDMMRLIPLMGGNGEEGN